MVSKWHCFDLFWPACLPDLSMLTCTWPTNKSNSFVIFLFFIFIFLFLFWYLFDFILILVLFLIILLYFLLTKISKKKKEEKKKEESKKKKWRKGKRKKKKEKRKKKREKRKEKKKKKKRESLSRTSSVPRITDLQTRYLYFWLSVRFYISLGKSIYFYLFYMHISFLILISSCSKILFEKIQ